MDQSLKSSVKPLNGIQWDESSVVNAYVKQGFLMELLYIYIHIPFCPSKCPFCAFKTGVRHPSTINHYVDKLCLEIEERLKNLSDPRLRTIYIGGGTPNLLSVGQLGKILETISHHMGLDSSVEITSEIHPKFMSKEKTKELMKLGFNRFSMGVQSLQDDDLSFLRRGYTSTEVQEKIAIVKECGVENLNLDFIIAIPGQTPERLTYNIETALRFRPSHLSWYLLSCDEGSHLTRERDKGLFTETDEEISASLYEHVCNVLGGSPFIHYEISNWAKAGYECVHHLGFWQGKPYLGFGLSATSFYGDIYYRNCSVLNAYLANPLSQEEVVPCLAQGEKSINKIIRQTRTLQGIEMDLFSPRVIQSLLDEKLSILIDHKLQLTPKGWLLNDWIIEQLVEARVG